MKSVRRRKEREGEERTGETWTDVDREVDSLHGGEES